MPTSDPAKATSAPPQSGVVVIGRNEGNRLAACLRDLQQQPRPVLYVDSGSTDGSPATARSLGAAVLELDPSRPFSAARARNEGAQALLHEHPDLSFVQFLDGDCLLAPGWLAAGEEALRADERCAVAFGHLRERSPQASIYNLLCALEWRSPSGRITNFSHIVGITMVRRSVFESLGGFNSSFIAGEDPEFGVRVAMAGFSACKVDSPMATHDANIHRFGQWWTRAVRAGHAIGQRAHWHAKSVLPDGLHERRSTLFWGVLLPLLIIVPAAATRGASLLLLTGYLFLGWRIAKYRLSLGDNRREAFMYSAFTVLGKYANAWGLLKYQINRLSGRFRIIEYK